MLVSLSVDYRRACLAVRERFHLDDEGVSEAYRRLDAAGATSAVLAQTCNRLEAYVWWPEMADDCAAPGEAASMRVRRAVALRICLAWCAGDEAEAEEMARFAIVATGEAAALHLLRVVAGLESQVLGDIHVLAQMRQAHRGAVERGRIGSPLHRLFEVAFRLGKRVRRETGLMSTRSGVGSEAARVADSIESTGGLIVVGCGKIGTQAARTLASRGARDVTIVNRTAHRAADLARQLGSAGAAGLEQLPVLLASARAVIVATDAREPILTRDGVASIRALDVAGDARPLVIIDISVPRNVDPEVGKLEGVELVDLDTLHPEASGAAAARRAAIPRVEALIDEASREYLYWLELSTVRAALHPLRTVLAEACRREIAHMTGDDPASSRTAERIVARVLAHPMAFLRSACERGEDVARPAEVLGSVFM
jgi:glutamyl-tRNA reductase